MEWDDGNQSTGKLTVFDAFLPREEIRPAMLFLFSKTHALLVVEPFFAVNKKDAELSGWRRVGVQYLFPLIFMAPHNDFEAKDASRYSPPRKAATFGKFMVKT